VELGLADLAANGTMSAEIAESLRETARRGRSFVVTAVPRLAGKTTVMTAMLGERPDGMPVRVADGSAAQLRGLVRSGERGYLLIPEIANAPVPGYLWGAPVRRVFAALGEGFALATALHSDGVEATFDIICRENRVPDEQAARISLVVYIRSLGTDWRAPTGRRVAAVDEVLGVSGGKPRTRRLHTWDEATNTFRSG
jgi:Flp pilus assembly CpaF family ATPase